jgi:hypothetical protein
MMNPHMFLLAKTLRRSTAVSLAARGGGGGSFHKPDPPLTPEYKHTRRVHLEDINTLFYHDYSPEFHMHLHSM